MKFSCYIMFCFATFSLVGCNGHEIKPVANKFHVDDVSLMGKAYSPYNDLTGCLTTSLQLKGYVTHLKSQLKTIITALFSKPFVYNKKKYLTSIFPYQSVNEAMRICAAFGGYLAEVDDLSEFSALQSNFLSSDNNLVMIGGSDIDKEGTWVFPRTGLPLPVLAWGKGQPDNAFFSKQENCLSLWRDVGGRMNDIMCNFGYAENRFMCEIPNHF